MREKFVYQIWGIRKKRHEISGKSKKNRKKLEKLLRSKTGRILSAVSHFYAHANMYRWNSGNNRTLSITLNSSNGTYCVKVSQNFSIYRKKSKTSPNDHMAI